MAMSDDVGELISVLTRFNPWWQGENISDISSWKRAAFGALSEWIMNSTTSRRAILISGARQVGKTTLVMQAIQTLLTRGIPAANILYVTFDHPIIKYAGIDSVLTAWREREPKQDGLEYIFIDEAQFIPEWGTWIKHQVDFTKSRRIIFTGSATPLLESEQESGVGRWMTLHLSTLSFYEYLQLKQIKLPKLPSIKSLTDIFVWEKTKYLRTTESAEPYVGHFHEYLIRGGFPETALLTSITQAQRLLREDIVDKILKRDMTALFGVRRILDLEHLFLYLCRHEGGALDMNALCSNLEINRPTAQNFLKILEAAHLIYRLHPYGYGKEILRGRDKVYLADAAIVPAVLLKGKTILDNAVALGMAAESAVVKHLLSHYYGNNISLGYWHNRKGLEVDVIAEIAGAIAPFEIKYRTQHATTKEAKGLLSFCSEKNINQGYLVTKSANNFALHPQGKNLKILHIPACLLCYWIGEMETHKS